MRSYALTEQEIELICMALGALQIRLLTEPGFTPERRKSMFDNINNLFDQIEIQTREEHTRGTPSS